MESTLQKKQLPSRVSGFSTWLTEVLKPVQTEIVITLFMVLSGVHAQSSNDFHIDHTKFYTPCFASGTPYPSSRTSQTLCFSDLYL